MSGLPLAADGAQAPFLIPDYVAYRHFLSVMAIRDTASERQVARRDAFLAEVELSHNDRAGLLSAMRGVREELDRIAEQRKSFPRAATDGSRGTDLKFQEDQIFNSAQARVLAALTTDGTKRLEAHIQHMKTRIKIYGVVR